MKKIMLLLLILSLLTACSDDELPPSPPAPGKMGVGGAIYGMAAMPAWGTDAKNIAITPSEVQHGQSLLISAGPYDYIYSNAYFFNSKTRIWEKLVLQGELNQNWIKGQAYGNLLADESKFAEGNNFIVIYACNKVLGKWECNNGKWMVVNFVVLPKAAQIPESVNLNQMIINTPITPFTVSGTLAAYDDFTVPGDAQPLAKVVRYDARYREPKGLTVLVHVFDFATVTELNQVMGILFRQIVSNGWKDHMGQNIAVFLGEQDHRIAIWTSQDKLIYAETFNPASANKEIIDEYLKKYPSDLQK